MDGTSVYQFWNAAVRGEGALAPRLPTGTGVDDAPQPGLYKVRQVRNGPMVPAQVWLSDETGEFVHVWRAGLTVRIAVDGREIDDVSTYSGHMYFQAVSKADWAYYAEHKTWPGEVPASPPAPSGDNTAGLTLADEVADVIEQAAAWLKSVGGVIKSQTESDSAANWKDRLVGLKGQLDRERDAKVRPHLEAQRSVNAEYKPIIDKAAQSAELLRALIGGWHDAERLRIEAAQAEARRAAEEKARAAREEAEAARKAAEAGAISLGLPADTFNAAIPIPDAPDLSALGVPIIVRSGGQYGKRTGARTVIEYEVTDYDAAYAIVKSNKDVRAGIDKAARAACKAAGHAVAGCVATEKTKVI